MLRIRAPGWLYTETYLASVPQKPHRTGERGAGRRYGRQPHDRLLAQVFRDARAELGALVDHAAIVQRQALSPTGRRRVRLLRRRSLIVHKPG